jgi:hypothetical protein
MVQSKAVAYQPRVAYCFVKRLGLDIGPCGFGRLKVEHYKNDEKDVGGKIVDYQQVSMFNC